MSDATPAERYAGSHDRAAHPALTEFRGLYGFDLDDFQARACRDLEDGRGVLVAAPTGSGKTVVGEFAVHLALHTGRKAFYTTPIKALSNQKYSDLVDRYGAEQVGLLTGDHSVNGEAPIVVMTTEVLRNMLYAGSRTLGQLGYVVMDEVHYLADRMRGAVWEEVIIHLPPSVSLVSLSATVSNAEEFGEWLETVRGDTATVVEERRPVPLYQHVMVGRRMHDLFARPAGAGSGAEPAGDDTRVNPQLLRVARDELASGQLRDRRRPKDRRKSPPQQRGGERRVRVPSRVEVLDRLQREGLLPAITFIFSRAGCDAAVRQCQDARVQLTTAEERAEIERRVEQRCAHLPEEDLRVLGYAGLVDALGRGVAAHHAGMLPTFKQCVEELFTEGLVKAVFATETLALGINMPARTVVLERLTKWNGEQHAPVTPGEYTQLTGRAGRRGLDVEGHAVVLFQPGTDPRELAGLASTRTYPLHSSFRPSYNMAVNLVHQYGRESTRELLEQSFAQFQADRAVVGLASKLRRSEEALAGYADAVQCDRGDFWEYAALRREVSDREKQAKKSRQEDRRQQAADSLTRLRRGDVVRVPAGKFAGWAVVTDPGAGGDEPRPAVVTERGEARRLGLRDFPDPVEAVTRVRVPKEFNPRHAQKRRDLAGALRHATRGLDAPATRRRSHQDDRDPEVQRLRAELRSHPCHECPEREDHARWEERHHELQRDTATLQRRVERRTNTVARQFDRVCEVLDALGYLDGDEVTRDGQRLRQLYSDADLVCAEALRRGLWRDLDAPGLAATLSSLVFEARRPEDAGPPALPGGAAARAVQATRELWAELHAVEGEHRLDQLREPDPGFCWAAWRWAEGDPLDAVLEETEMPAGDFVRWVNQVLDLADQVAVAADDGSIRDTARRAADCLDRGVVTYSSFTE